MAAVRRRELKLVACEFNRVVTSSLCASTTPFKWAISKPQQLALANSKRQRNRGHQVSLTLRHHFFHHFIGNVEVGGHGLHVVVVF